MQSLERSIARKRRRLNPAETGPFVLRPVLENIPLDTDEGQSGPVSITCSEYWNNHLYIGTSASEILHFVSLPSDEDQDEGCPTFILASRLQPSGHSASAESSGAENANQQGGVQQILVLPGPAKACVLCNGVVSFYSLPELTPAFPNKEPSGVQWIGGIDEDEEPDVPDGKVVMIANSKRILLVRVGEKLRPVKSNIEYPGCLKASRRGTIACVADKNTYALLEVEHQQKIPLFPISSVPSPEEQETSDLLASDTSHQVTGTRLSTESPGHSRSTSLGTFMGSMGNRQLSPQSHDRNTLRPQDTPIQDSARSQTLSPSRSEQPRTGMNPSTRPRSATDASPARSPQRQSPSTSSVSLKPHILSPSSSEFLLTTGSGKDEPGVGLFVNLDGDVVRGTVEFERYPDAVSIDFGGNDLESSIPSGQKAPDDTIFALMKKTAGETETVGLEIQTLSADPAAMSSTKAWLPVSRISEKEHTSAGLQLTLSTCSYMFYEVGNLLRLVRFKAANRSPASPAGMVEADPRTKAAVERMEEERALFDHHADDSQSDDCLTRDKQRNIEEQKFAKSLGHTSSRTMTWCDNGLWQVVANPEVLRLEASLWPDEEEDQQLETFNISKLKSTLQRIKDREPQTETEFLTLNYIRQKASMMLLLDVLKNLSTAPNGESGKLDQKISVVENALLSGGVDPRIVLLLFPGLRDEVLEGSQGIWIHQGLSDLLKGSLSTLSRVEALPDKIWLMLRRFLSSWQDKRGYGSIADEKHVFDSVDTALLRVLLHLDKSLPPGSGVQVATHTKLNNVVDHWKGDFDRAITLLEEHQRLFILSRLYQSRKLSKNVLQTWKRIADGEHDLGGEMTVEKIESRVRYYLVNIRDAAIVKDCGVWLAGRNPDLAIQLFTDDACRVKFTPQEVTSMLKEHAPGAVQQYLEHLVFNKRLEQYAEDLISYYLDSVLSVLESSEKARTSLAESYSTYRALEKPKPTYLNFIAANTPTEPWWQSRLRLLQLLGSGSYATSSSTNDLIYSIPKVLERLAPFSTFLVSESIILDARQGHHKQALRLLTHGLGDYDTAVRYCYFGGPTHSFSSSSQPVDASQLPPRETQAELFAHLFAEFLLIADPTDRVERASELLAKFASFFDPLTVFAQLPETWEVGQIAEFLTRALRLVTSEANEVRILKGLSAAQNLQRQAQFVDACEKFGEMHDVDGEVGRHGQGIKGV